MAQLKYQAPRGTVDVLPGESREWIALESAFRSLASSYGYGEVRTPTFEDTNLFLRTAGDTSEIVTKQMYTFIDKGDRSITLKPEGTAPAMRAMLEGNLLNTAGLPLRMCYVTPFFRYERPQKGRLREAHQFGLELVGSRAAAADAEIIEATIAFYAKIGLTDLTVLLNSIGREACRARYQEELIKFAEPILAEESVESRARALKNPLRLLDSKDPKMVLALKEAPSILDFLEDESKARFEAIQEMLSSAKVRYKISPDIVRGLDYYTETVFEVHSDSLGAQGALCGGGRYDYLIREIGGPDTPSVGVGIGVERLMIALEAASITVAQAKNKDVYIAPLSQESLLASRSMSNEVRRVGWNAIQELDTRSLKAQLKQADRLDCHYAVLIGGDELAEGVATVRNLKTGEQHRIPLENGIGTFLCATHPGSE